jgi:hypothetical protein
MSATVTTRAAATPPPSLDGLHFIDADPVLRKARKVLLQIFALDYLILNTYGQLIQNLQGNQSVNPYAFVASKADLDEIESYCGGARAGVGVTDLCSAFKIYTISISLQKIFSYVFINPQQFDGLQTIDVGQLSDLLAIDGTTDKISDEDKKYIKETRDSTTITQLEIANSGTTLKTEVENLILAAIDAIGDLSNSGDETRIPDQYRIVEPEFQREITLSTALFEGVDSAGNPLTVDTVIQYAGLKELFKAIINILPDDIYEIYGSPILEGSIDAWLQFFTQQNTQIIDMLVSTLPTIQDRFANVTPTPTPPTTLSITCAPNDTQIDFRYNGQRLMADFLNGALLPVRLDELTNLSNNPLAITFLKVFRSLLVLPDINQTHGIWFSGPGLDPNTNDPTSRLSFLYILYWLLTPLRELNVLFTFATTRLDPRSYQLIMTLVVPSSLFPGNLDLTGAGPQTTGISIQSDFDNDNRNMIIKQSKVARSGQLAATLNSDGIGWFI